MGLWTTAKGYRLPGSQGAVGGAVLPILSIQIGTYLTLGTLFILRGEYKLGIAQLLLAGVQALLFS